MHDITFKRPLIVFLNLLSSLKVLDNEEPDVKKTTALTTVLTSLRKFTNYSIQILSYTRMGDGVLSAPKFCHTEEDGKINNLII